MDELEKLALHHSRDRYRDDKGEDAADLGLLIGDIAMYGAAISSTYLAILMIWNDTIYPQNWLWDDADWLMFGPAIGLWVCSQSLNNFRRLLPMWLRGLLGLPLTPENFAELSKAGQKRRGYTLMISSVLAGVIAWRCWEYEDQDAMMTRAGVEFQWVVVVLASVLLILGFLWMHLAGKDSEIEMFEDRGY